MSRKARFVDGCRKGIPITFGYVPMGIGYAAIAIKAGFTPLQTISMSFLVYDQLQLKIIAILDDFRVNRLPVTVRTGWGRELGENYYITDISVNQGDTYQQSELSVTVKELRFTEIQIVPVTNEDIRSLEQSEKMSKVVTGQVEGELKSKAYIASGRE